MKTLALLVMHVLTLLAQRVGPGGAKVIIAESVLIKHQHLLVHRSGGKAPRLTTLDRFLCGFLVLFMHPRRIRKAAVVFMLATLTKFRRILLSRNYRRLFSSRTFREAATKFLEENLYLASIGDYAMHLKQLDPFIGDLPLENVHLGTLQPFIEVRREQAIKSKSINHVLGVVRRILNLAARLWRDDNGLT